MSHKTITRFVGSLILAATAALSGFRTAPAFAADDPRRTTAPTTISSEGIPVARPVSYPGPYQDLSGVRSFTLDEVIAIGNRVASEGTLDLATAFDPGVDPPYDPTDLLDEVRAPWSPPVGGAPTDVTSGPYQPPAGPDERAPIPSTPWSRVQPVPAGCIGSKFVYKSITADNLWLPAWGWTVHVWIRADDQTWTTHKTELDTFGEWTYCPTPDEANRDLLYGYEAANDLVKVVDNRHDSPTFDHPYWRLPPWNIHAVPPPPGGIYPKAATTPSSGDFGMVLETIGLNTGPAAWGWNDGDPQNLDYGVGDIMGWAMEALVTAKLAGVDVGVAQPIRYPNVGTKCEGLVRWSCYIFADGNIYLGFQPEHVNRFVLQHEIAHAIEGAHRAPDTGGEHWGTSCSTEAKLAYSEGFANFFAVWAANPDRTKTPATYEPGFDIETPPGCGGINETGATSEVQVAAAMWDLHDHRADGADTSGMKSIAAIINFYLLDPANNMVEFRHHVIEALKTETSKAFADGVFKQNLIPTTLPD